MPSDAPDSLQLHRISPWISVEIGTPFLCRDHGSNQFASCNLASASIRPTPRLVRSARADNGVHGLHDVHVKLVAGVLDAQLTPGNRRHRALRQFCRRAEPNRPRNVYALPCLTLPFTVGSHSLLGSLPRCASDSSHHAIQHGGGRDHLLQNARLCREREAIVHHFLQ